MTKTSTEIIASKKAVCTYLIEQGWHVKINKDGKNSKVYKALGRLPKKKGGWEKTELDLYAKKNLQQADEDVATVDMSEKIKQEIRVTSARADKIEFENEILQGKHILRSEVEQLHAAKALHLKTAIIGFFQSQTAVMVSVCGGDPDKVADVRELCLNEIQLFLHEYSKPCRYSIPVVAAEV